jgi:hypothetical protein
MYVRSSSSAAEEEEEVEEVVVVVDCRGQRPGRIGMII